MLALNLVGFFLSVVVLAAVLFLKIDLRQPRFASLTGIALLFVALTDVLHIVFPLSQGYMAIGILAKSVAAASIAAAYILRKRWHGETRTRS